MLSLNGRITLDVSCDTGEFEIKIMNQKIITGQIRHRWKIQRWNKGEGKDRLGAFSYYSARLETGKKTKIQIRTYWNFPAILFSVRNPCINNEYESFDHPIFLFPTLEINWMEYKGFTCSYWCWPTPVFFSSEKLDKIPKYSSFIFLKNLENIGLAASPANAFLPCYIATEVKNGTIKISLALNGEVERIPENSKFESIIVFGNGIKESIQNWGKALTKLYNKSKADFNRHPLLKYVGYWTDKGAYYYYRTEKKLSYDETLKRIIKYLKENGFKPGYIELDSWWYEKGDDNGILTWTPDPTIFKDFEHFLSDLKCPIVLHSRFFSTETPLKKYYQFIDGADSRGKRLSIPLDSDKVYHEMAANASKWRCIGYEQDWLTTHEERIERIRSSIDFYLKWLEAMAKAFEHYEIPIIYCMPTTAFYLASLHFPSVIAIRTSDDYYAKRLYGNEHLWIQNFYCSLIAYSLALYPFFDVFITSENHPKDFKEPYAAEEALARALSCGPIGIGDRLGCTDFNILRRICLPDGTLIKPDRPAFPLEKCFDNDPSENGLIVETLSEFSGLAWRYVAVWNVSKNDLVCKLDRRMWEGEYVLYEWFGKAFTAEDVKFRLAPRQVAYYVYAPIIGQSSLIVDSLSYVTNSKIFVREIYEDYDGGWEVTIESPCSVTINPMIMAFKPIDVFINDRFIKEVQPGRPASLEIRIKPRIPVVLKAKSHGL